MKNKDIKNLRKVNSQEASLIKNKKQELKKLCKKYYKQRIIKMKNTVVSLPNNIVIELLKVQKIVPLNSKLLKIIKGVDLKIYKKDFIIFLGKSGSGKTSLLGIMSALERPSEGSVNILGNLTQGLNDSQLTRLRKNHIGYIFQQYGLLDSVSVLDNAMISANKNNLEMAKKKIEQLGLKSFLNKNVSDLSGGQQQRVSIARAIAKNPDIIFADEPTGAVDSKTAKDIVNIFRDLNNEGKTIIMVTHNKNLSKIGNRIIEISDGKIISDEKNIPIPIDDVIWN